MRVVLDLQSSQTLASRGRGVGRYSECLARHLLPLLSDVRVCLNGNLAETAASMVRSFHATLAPTRFSLYRHPPVARADGVDAAALDVSEAIVRQHWMALQPDVLHISHVFEGLARDVVVPRKLPRVPGVAVTATLFDLIPLRFPDRYLANAGIRRWYDEKLGTLRQCDHLLAISEATRQDAVALLGLDPRRITTIHGAADARFRPRRLDAGSAESFLRRHGLRGAFVLYTAGDDHRKNLDGAVAGYAALPPYMRQGLQLVCVCAMSEGTRTALRAQARRAGLADDELVLTGFVGDDELVSFYSHCEAFVFPSLYEGFGLPVLEAMQCGAAVVASDNSSVAEIVGRPDALFDARSPAAIGDRLARVLRDRDFRADLQRHGLERARAFTWESTATRAAEALHEATRQAAPPSPAAAAPFLPKRRIALFTPLPPCRSGIADYNAALLPFLARHFDIDLYVDDDVEVTDGFLKANFPIRSWRAFDARSSEYDAVVYEMGNSEFHAYMLDVLRSHPGIVVLHDAYLSGLWGHVDFRLGQSGRLVREMLAAHGPRARRYFAPARHDHEAAGRAMVALPATKPLIDAAIGVVSHSPFNRDLAAAEHPEGWTPPYRIVPQMTRRRPPPDAARRAATRTALGLHADDILVCTFGHVVWTKCGDLLLEAFLRSSLLHQPRARLLFVGELANDAFGLALARSIAASGLGERIKVTGYLEEATYESYLSVADLAVQLRIHSRGGTPKGVLDAMAHGIPVAVNNAASYEDYPDDVVVKLPPQPTIEAVCGLLDRLPHDAAALHAVAARGLDYVTRAHGGEQIAATFASYVEEFIARARAASLPALVREVGRRLAADPGGERLAEPVAVAIHSTRAMLAFAPRRLLVDVSHIAAGDHGTGIQRVVAQVVRQLYCSARAGVSYVAVTLVDGRLVEASAWLDSQGLRTEVERADGSGQAVQLRWGDTLLMLDSSWERYAEFAPVFAAIRALGGTIHTVVYDVLPLRLPHCWPPGASEWFRGWLTQAARESDALVCISRSVADEVYELVRTGELPAGNVRRLGYFHLGADALPVRHSTPTGRVKAAFSAPPVLLMVGTLEPRKNHALALDALERLWQRGMEVGLCIAGRQGWMVESLIQRLAGHPERGRRLHVLDAPSDDELQHCYRLASALLFPSLGEGFGLPIIEAARTATPILVSDLPVMREVAGEHATYVSTAGADALADDIAAWLRVLAQGRAPSSAGIAAQGWEESAEQLVRCILDSEWYRRLDGLETT